MKHYIIAKFKEECSWKELVGPVREIFEAAARVPGIHGVNVKPCCIARPNRYDIMIEIDMDKDALSAWDACESHKRWKEEYGPLLQAKTIFDSED